MSVKDTIDTKLRRTAEDLAANAVIVPAAAVQNDPAVQLANYPGAREVVKTRNGSIVVTY